jgi:hypothetical protein
MSRRFSAGRRKRVGGPYGRIKWWTRIIGTLIFLFTCAAVVRPQYPEGVLVEEKR